MKRGHAKPTYTDPVCGMELSLTTAVEEAEYKGRRYYFCAKVCRDAFDAEPERYVQEHTKEKTQ